ncbi:MAG: stage III sporulation protein AA [Brotaphodocola sp.]
MDRREEVIKIFSNHIRTILRCVSADFDQVQEIRLRVNAPLLIIFRNLEFYVTQEGKLTKYSEEAYVVSKQELKETLEYISNYSLYAFEEEIRQGFITIQGGHRVGLAGKVICDENGIRSMKFISFMNVRLSHQIRGCADSVLPYLYHQGNIVHTLLISPPRCGKTTMLRDLIRQISNGSEEGKLETDSGKTDAMPVRRAGMTVGVVDERSELGACYQGIPQNDLGIRTDILDCCPKAQGMMMLIRTMSPQVIAVDEIGSREELEAMEYAMNCGCKLIATVHGGSLEDIRQKPVLSKMVQERWFERYVVLNHGAIGKVKQIYDSSGKQMLEREFPNA